MEVVLAQRVRDAAAATAAVERLATAQSEAAVAAGARERLAARLDAKERALGAIENQARAHMTVMFCYMLDNTLCGAKEHMLAALYSESAPG